MVKRIFVAGVLLGICSSLGFVHAGEKVYVLENSYMSRTLVVKDGVLSTKQIVNKQAGANLVPVSCQEFALRISEGTDKEGRIRF